MRMRCKVYLLLASLLLIVYCTFCPTVIADESREKSEIDKTITVTLPDGSTMEMVWIEPGTFLMGSPDSEQGRWANEGPQHKVTIKKGFYLGKYEVTKRQWENVMGTRPWEGWEGKNLQKNADYPASYVSWEDVQKFILLLNEAVGTAVYRLPKEAEWEYACRAGTTTRWSFGDDEGKLKEYAWYFDKTWSREAYAHKVGTKLPNPWGLYDMYGNLSEWCQDWYGAYSDSAQVDPTGPGTGSLRVTRGGGFFTPVPVIRSARRIAAEPSRRLVDVGFRLLRKGP